MKNALNLRGRLTRVCCYDCSILFSSVAQSCPTFCDPMDCRTPGFPVHHQLLELAQTHVHWVSDAFPPSHPLSSPSPAFSLSQHQDFFQGISSWIRWPKYCSFSFSISPSSEYSGLISFGIDWSDILAVQGTLKSLLQHHSSKPSILQCSAFFMVQLSHLHMTTRKSKTLTIQTFVGKVMSLLFNMLSMLVIAFLPRSKHLSISWLQSPSAVILELKKIKSVTVPIISSPVGHEVMGPDAMILVFWMLSFTLAFSLSSFTFIKNAFFTQSFIPQLSPELIVLLPFYFVCRFLYFSNLFRSTLLICKFIQ